MSVQVVVSKFDNDRYMVGDDITIEEFNERDKVAYNNAVDAELAHEKWFAEAKDKTGELDNDEIILADARRHLEDARALKSPVADGSSSYDSRWSLWVDSFYQQIREFTTCQQVLHFAQSRIPFDHRFNVNSHKSEIVVYEKMVEEEFPHNLKLQLKLGDNPRSVPETLLLAHGHLVSNVFFWNLRVMFACQKYISPLTRIMEIGGGYGALARLWMTNETAKLKRYVIVDLPESLFYSEVCLRAEFGDQVGYWEGSDPKTKIVLVPVGCLHEYKQLSDLVINVGSLQEMSDSWVNYYMNWLDEYKPRFFYSLNYMGQFILTMFESRNFWAPRLSMKWATKHFNADVPLVRMQCTGRDFAEAIYEYTKPIRKFADWSVLKGCFFNRATYLEGLELLRQDLTIENCMTFLRMITENNDANKLRCPKETFFIASMVMQRTNDPSIKVLLEKLDSYKKMAIR